MAQSKSLKEHSRYEARTDDTAGVIRVGLTEAHGMASEISEFPPDGVSYSFPASRPSRFRIVRSPIKGYLRHFETAHHEIIEAIISPILTNSRWIYSLECLPAAVAFNIFGCPVPRSMRIAFIKHLVLKDNCKRLVFWSQAGKETLHTYGEINDDRVLEKVEVVYPAIRNVQDGLIRFNDRSVTLLFSGDFFRKGGVNVIDAFERAQQIYPSIKLRLCCDEKLDFNTPNAALKGKYLDKIRNNSGIIFCRVPRDDLIRNILPNTDIYLLPTYVETFGFALLEAMAFGIPVISTNHFAIPEIVEDGVAGFLIDTRRFNCDQLFRGYVVKRIPSEFREYITENVFKYLCQLIESPELRKQLGMSGVNIARTKFSFETRNSKMLAIYRRALQ
jgi:glycosyltransferase involved in cell wall biosynthesis